MKTVSILVVLSLFSSAAARLARGERPSRGHVDLKHISDAVSFKIRKDDRQGLRGGEVEHERISRIVNAVGQAVEHLTGGSIEPKRVFRHAGVNEQKHIDAGLHLWYRFNVAKKGDEEEKFAPQQRAVEAVRLLKSHAILAAELDVVETKLKIRQSYRTDDPYLSLQNVDHYNLVKLPEAWNMTAGSSDVVVQVIDSGIDMTHPDLQINKWSNTGETDCTDGIDNDGNGYVDDCQGYNNADDSGTNLEGDGSHGTHCAGTIAADNDNAVGVAGVAGGKGGVAGASLMINVVFGAVNTDGFEDALVYGADNGAHISSNSWGYTSPSVYDQTTLDAIDYADNAGVVVVFAAGNDGTNEDWYPGYYSPTIAVAALDKDGVAAYFTNYGDWVDISGPGYPVYSTVSVAEGSYDYYSGTSMACPHIAGGLALAKSYAPGADSTILKSCLQSSAVAVDSLNVAQYADGLGAGVMDIPALILCASGQSPTPIPTITPAPTYTITPSPTSMPVVCGTCDHTLTLEVKTDAWASESSYSLSETTSSGGCFADVTGPASSWSDKTEYTVTVSDSLCDDTQYDFTFHDSYGDGICCSYGSGYYSLRLDGVKYFTSDGQFDSSETFTFSTSPVPAPTLSPIPAPTMAPPSVSSCDDLGWTNAETYGESDVCGNTGNCVGKMTYASAELYCEDMGARMCTVSELLDDETRGTGCGYDNKFVWSKTPCDGGYVLAKGSSTSNSLPKCKRDSKKGYARCCADVGDGTPVPAPTKAPTVSSVSSCTDLGWTNAAARGDADVCGNSKDSTNTCSGKKKWAVANNWCENQGARLCTLDELLDDEARGTGCSLDDDKVWSGTACNDGYYVAAGSSLSDMTECKTITNKVKVRCCADEPSV